MLKYLAVLFMVVDHVGVFLVPPSSPWYQLMRAIGRLAFPMFAYSIAVGFTRTRSPFRYLLRMALFALAGEVLIKGTAFLTHLTVESVWRRIDVFSWTNVMVTFAFAIVMLVGIDTAWRSSRDMVAGLRPVCAAPGGPSHYGVRMSPTGLSLPPLVGIPLGIVLAVAPFFAVTWLESDYDVFGLLAVLCFYLPLRLWPPAADGSDPCRAPRVAATSIAYVLLNLGFCLEISLRYNTFYWIEALSVLALPFIFAHWKDRRPSRFGKYFFYVFYPVHFALLIYLHTLLFP